MARVREEDWSPAGMRRWAKRVSKPITLEGNLGALRHITKVRSGTTLPTRPGFSQWSTTTIISLGLAGGIIGFFIAKAVRERGRPSLYDAGLDALS